MHRKNGSTGTSLWNEFSEVPCAIADKRGGFFPEGGNNHLTNFSRGYRLKGFRIEEFEDIVVCPIVNAFVIDTVKPCPRAIEFRQTRNIEDVFHSQKLLHPISLSVAGTFRAHDDLFKCNALSQISFLDLLPHQESHGGSGAEDS
jgi:hypothetical protein